MAGTKTGGLKAAQTNKQRYGKAFYKRIGSIGGIKSKGGGFAKNSELARLAGKIGGMHRSKSEMTEAQYNAELEIREQIKQLKENA